MLNYFAKIIVFLITIIVLFSCNATKRVPEGSYLLEKNRVIVDNKTISNPEVLSYLRQKPNLKILGYPFSLQLYNLGNPQYETRFEEWLKENPKKEKRLTKLFSEKQVKALGKSYRGIHSWFLRNGSPPVISDSSQIKKSARSLYNYYLSKGYFEAEVTFKENKKDNKRVIVDYLITKNDPFFIDTLSTRISSPVLDSIYQIHKDKSLIKNGDQIEYKKLENEVSRLNTIFRNSGIYTFNDNIVQYDIDSLTSSHKKDVVLKIPDRIIEKNDSVYTAPFKIRKVKNVNVYTDFSFDTKNDSPQDSASYKGYTFYAFEKLKYNPKYLANAIIIEPNGIYKDSERDITRTYLRELQNFRPSVDIKYIENADESLTANIYLTPLKKYSLGFDTELITSNIKPFGVLGKFSLLNRNLFRGAEILELSFQGSFVNTSRDVSDNAKFFNAFEVGVSAALKIPRIVFPISTRRFIPKRMTPKTRISLSTSVQRNIGLDRQNVTGGIDYTWKSSLKTNHKFELLNVQYINNQRVENYFNIFNSEYNRLNEVSQVIFNTELTNNNTAILSFIDLVLDPTGNYESTNPDEYLTVQNVNEQRDILKEDVLVPVLSYTYNYNNRENFSDNSFSTFTGRFISSGSITSAFVKSPSDGSQKKLFGLPVAQYLKTEFEYKKYWAINSDSYIVFRSFLGGALPFGNSDDIPFSRSYRAGGSNDIRAWRTFNLGPGTEKSTLEFNTSSLKFTTNLEYRFKVINKIYSALFIDAGNIWDITGSSISSEEAKFKGLSSLKDIAVGSGFGIRYDFSFLVFRLDIGFKTYEPYLTDTNKWFQNYNFNNAVYNIGINYPF